MPAAVHVVELGLRDGVVDVDGREEELAGVRHGVEAVHARRRLLGDALHARGDLVPLVGLLRQRALDDREDDLELGVVRARRVGQRAVLGVGVLGLPALVHEERHVAAVVDDEVRAVALGVGVRPGDGVHRALPVLLERLALPGEDGGRAVARDRRGGVVLRREDVARAPADVAAELLERLDEDRRLDRHVERARDARALERLRGAVLLDGLHEAGHLVLGELDLAATEVGERNVRDAVVTLRGVFVICACVCSVARGRGGSYARRAARLAVQRARCRAAQRRCNFSRLLCVIVQLRCSARGCDAARAALHRNCSNCARVRCDSAVVRRCILLLAGARCISKQAHRFAAV